MAPMKSPTPHEHPSELEDSYSLTHLAHRWGVSRKTIRHLLQTGELSFVQVDGQIRVPVEAVQQAEQVTSVMSELKSEDS